jgi:hypothetical protein
LRGVPRHDGNPAEPALTVALADVAGGDHRGEIAQIALPGEDDGASALSLINQM